MSLNDILKLLLDAWFFAWRPVVLCAIMYIVARFLNQSTTQMFVNRIVDSAKSNGVRLENYRHILEPYGLNKLIPVIFMLLVVGFMLFLNGPLSSAVRNLPPQVGFYPELLVSRGMTQEDMLLIIRKYPQAERLQDAYDLMLSDAQVGLPSIDTTNWYDAQLFLKFAVLFAIVIVFINIKMGQQVWSLLSKYAVVLMISAVLWFISLAGLLFEAEYVFEDHWDMATTMILQGASDDLLQPASSEEEAIMDEKFMTIDRRKRWWWLHFVNTNQFEWLRGTFLPSLAYLELGADP